MTEPDEIALRTAELATMEALAVVEVVKNVAEHYLSIAPAGSAGAIVAEEVLDAVERKPHLRLPYGDIDEKIVPEEET